LQLKGAGLVESTRGASGGYRLLKPPAEIALGDVMAIIEGPPTELKSNAAKTTATTRALLDVWRAVAEAEQEMLSGVTFAELAERVKGHLENMYYI
jgi:Rrf2 family protein